MIAYTNITLKQLINEAVMRLGENRTATNLDWLTMVKYANRAIREVMLLTLPYKDWAYVSTISVAHRMALPQKFIKPIRVMLSETGLPPYREARLVDIKEYHGLTNWEQQDKWLFAKTLSPVYMLWGTHIEQAVVGGEPIPAQVTVYIAPNTDYQTGTAPTGFTYNTAVWSGVMDCYLVPDDITEDTDTIDIPYEFEELVIYLTMQRFLIRDTHPELQEKVQKIVMKEFANVFPDYLAKQKTEEESSEEYRKPLRPITPPKITKGEVPYKL